MNAAQSNQPVTDDAELAQVLSGMSPGGDPAAQAASALQFEESPIPQDQPAPTDQPPTTETESAAEVVAPASSTPPEMPVVPSAPALDTTPSPAPLAGSGDSQLDSIKQTALNELRPLVDKLNLPADEKFDTLLLIIRSTDDKTLLNSAHETARAIEDETKRAQALLDVIKEIDYFAAQKPAV